MYVPQYCTIHAIYIYVTSVTLLLYGHSADGRGESFIPYSMTYQHNLHVTDPKLKIGVPLRSLLQKMATEVRRLRA